MWHLAAYAETIDNTADTDVNALTDEVLTIQNNHFVLREDMNLYAALAMSATLTRAKISSPSLRIIAAPYIRPVNVSATPGNNANVMLLNHSPMRIPWGEEIQVLATSGVAMTEAFVALALLGKQLVPAPRGNIIPVRWSSTTAAVAATWTTLTITWADTLPSGIYAAVMSEHQSTTGKAHRWNFPEQLYRPGFPSFTALSQRLPYAMALQQFGLMGTFRSNALPTPQVLCGSTDNAHEGYLHVVRIGPLT